MSIRDRLAWVILTFGGTGASPIAPGTVGSLAALIVVFGLWNQGIRDLWLLPVLAVGIGLLHLAVGGRIPAIFGKPDPGAVVSDEACGQWLALSVPISTDVPIGVPLVVGFLLFRLFDITKPPGVRYFDRRHDKWGVLFDDVVAGVYAGAVLYALDVSGGLEELSRIFA